MKGQYLKRGFCVVDKILLFRKLSDLEQYFEQIREYKNLTIQEYSENWKTQRIIERTLQLMIEICADIANHIISDSGYRVPTSYADTFKVLFENKLIETDLFERMEKMAKFRNIIVHHYDKIDEAIIISILKNNLNDFIKYKECIVTILKK
jgi:uncharacterized protein YutE (UPF0331/DUF86 family)